MTTPAPAKRVPVGGQEEGAGGSGQSGAEKVGEVLAPRFEGEGGLEGGPVDAQDGPAGSGEWPVLRDGGVHDPVGGDERPTGLAGTGQGDEGSDATAVDRDRPRKDLSLTVVVYVPGGEWLQVTSGRARAPVTAPAGA